MKDLNKQVGQAIRKFRRQRGLTQEQLAEASGIHEKHIGIIERGIQGVSLTYLCKLAAGLNMNVVDLVKSIFGEKQKDENKEQILKELYSFLQEQTVGDLKSMRQVISCLQRARATGKPLILVEVETGRSKKQKSYISIKRI